MGGDHKLSTKDMGGMILGDIFYIFVGDHGLGFGVIVYH
jgi:hypothetical protein